MLSLNLPSQMEVGGTSGGDTAVLPLKIVTNSLRPSYNRALESSLPTSGTGLPTASKQQSKGVTWSSTGPRAVPRPEPCS